MTVFSMKDIISTFDKKNSLFYNPEMDDNFKTIYKILCAFEKSLDIEKFNSELISAERLNISQTRLEKYLLMLCEAEYLSGFEFEEDIAGSLIIKENNPHITLKGFEYLSENSIMQRMYRTAKGIKDFVK